MEKIEKKVGRKVGYRKENPKLRKSFRLEADLFERLEKLFPEKTVTLKIEEAIQLYLEKYEE